MPERFKHTYYIAGVKKYLKDPTITRNPNTAPKATKAWGVSMSTQIEGKRIAFEMTSSFSNLMKNIQKCQEMGMQK